MQSMETNILFWKYRSEEIPWEKWFKLWATKLSFEMMEKKLGTSGSVGRHLQKYTEKVQKVGVCKGTLLFGTEECVNK